SRGGGGPGRRARYSAAGAFNGAAARSVGQTMTHSPLWICLMLEVVGQKLFSAGSNVSLPLNVVSAPALCSESQIALLSRLFADLTPETRISQAFQEAAACVSNTVYGRFAALARA